jgi:shikimate kinase
MTRSIVLIGFKSCGKSTVGRLLAGALGLPFVDLDNRIEAIYQEEDGRHLPCREIFKRHGEGVFRSLETTALEQLATERTLVLATGGGAPLAEANRPLLRALGRIVYLQAAPFLIYRRFQHRGMPAFMAEDSSYEHLHGLWLQRHAVYLALAEAAFDVTLLSPQESVATIAAWARQQG